MSANYIALGMNDLLFAALLLVFNGILSIVLQLKLERSLLINSLRMVVQLSAIGFILKYIFAQNSLWVTAFWALLMIGFAGYEILARQSIRIRGLWGYGLGTSLLLVSGLLTAVLGTALFIRPEPWYDPRYFLPVLGMILGNGMTGISLGLDRFLSSVHEQKGAVEAQLALGACAMEAMRPQMIGALRTGMVPMINMMGAAGLVSIPGMMTGQILSGADPVDAAKYQVLIILLIVGATSIGTLMGVYGAARLVTDERQRLRLDRLLVK